jgi:FkbM family methyltransferase
MLTRLKRAISRRPRLYFAAAISLIAMQARRKGYRLGWGKNHVSVRDADREIRVSKRHVAYLGDMVREFDRYFASVVPISLDGRLVADFSQPAWHSVPGLEGEFYFTSLPEERDAATAYLSALSLASGDVILDLGAYCGLTTYQFSVRVGPAGRVIAVEADPANYAALRRNVDRHRLANVTALNAAAWSETGELFFENEGSLGSSISTIAPRSGQGVKVPAYTLMGIAQQNALATINHVKMDIEGAEYAVLGSHEADIFFSRYRPDLIVEIHRDDRGAINIDKIKDRVAGFGYRSRQVPQSQFEAFPLWHFSPLDR